MKRYIYATSERKKSISSLLNAIFHVYVDAALNRTSVSKTETYPVGTEGYKVTVNYSYSYAKDILQCKYRVQVIHPKGGVVEEHNFVDSDAFAACMAEIAHDYA